MSDLPSELDLDEYRVARSLASPNIAVRRFGVQSVIIRTSYHHIRFTLHRPYASAIVNNNGVGTGKSSNIDASKTAQSLEVAVSSAEKLITMVGQSRPDFAANVSLAVPGHMNWGPFHCFAAAMFFSFQLIAGPDQPGAGLFRSSIRKAMSTLEQCRGSAVADKAFTILETLAPLYSPDFLQEGSEIRENTRTRIFSDIRKLALPYYDSHTSKRSHDSPNGRTVESPVGSTSVSPPLEANIALPVYDPTQTQPPIRSPTNPYPQGPSMNGHLAPLPDSPQGHTIAPVPHPPSLGVLDGPYPQAYPMAAPHPYDARGYNNQYNMHAVDDTAIWGAAVGLGHGEWTQILDELRPGLQAPNHSRHIPGS